jgi:dihydroorotate dehydrogenase
LTVDVLYRTIRPLLFRLEPERAHALAFSVLRIAQRLCERRSRRRPADPLLRQSLWGLDFPNPVGLAAGLDKNGELPHVWAALGFGFAELGTVTALAQPGNPAPRLFRLPTDQALINRLGFNNHGAESIARGLARRLRHGRPPVPLGINLGKSRLAALDQALADHLQSLRAVYSLADYVTINVSSPNTPGLRDLQAAAQLDPLLAGIQSESLRLAERHRRPPLPLLLKVAPDLSDAQLVEIAQVATTRGAAGLIATNTTLQRPPLLDAARDEAGGLSGAPLRQRSTEVVRVLHRAAGDRLTIVGVGGIFNADDAYEKIRAGASLVQVYTGLIYQGPLLPRTICNGLRARLGRDGFAHIGAAVGAQRRPDRHP